MVDGGDRFEGRIAVAQRTRGYPVDLNTRLGNGHLDKDIDELVRWPYSPAAQPEIATILEK